MREVKALQRLALAALLAIAMLVVSAVWAQDSNQAALIIRFGDDRVESYCVTFGEETISGYELLERAGLVVEAQEVGMGASVCRVDDVGCSSGNCFCQCRGGDCRYWSYWRLQDGAWQYSVSGASITSVAPGDIQGWSWGPGSVSEAVAPPVTSFEEICLGAGDESLSGGALATAVAIDPPGAATEPATAVGAQPDSESRSLLGFALLLAVLAALALVASRRKKGHE